MLLNLILAFSLLHCVPDYDTIELAMNLSTGIYLGSETDFSYLDNLGGVQLINHVEHIGIPKFSLWKSPANVLWLIVRGSEDVDDWIVDFEFVEIANETLGAHFHSGFFFSAEGVWNEVADTVKKQNLSIFITGHSRGASVAEILHVIGRRDLINSGLTPSIQTIAYAPMPTMSPEGDVLAVQQDITIFVHYRDIVPILFFKPIAEAVYTLCQILDSQEKSPICQVIENKDIDDFINQYVHINTVIGGNDFWLKYNCDFLGLNCKVKPDLKDAWSSAEELMKFDIERLSLLNGTAFADHNCRKYIEYMSQVTHFSSITPLAPSPAPAPNPVYVEADDKKKVM